jgi:hypothetical protein
VRKGYSDDGKYFALLKYDTQVNERKFNTLCVDCGGNTEAFFVNDRIWYDNVPSYKQKGSMCLKCLEKRLGRSLTKSDFKHDDAGTFTFNQPWWDKIKESVNEYNNPNLDSKGEPKDYELGDTLTYRQMVSYILDNKLQSLGEEIDYNEARDIAAASDLWELKMVKLDNFDWVADSDYANPSVSSYPIVVDYGDEMEVLDGKHRIGMLNDKEYIEYPMWIGKFD